MLTAQAELFTSQILLDEFAEVIARLKFAVILERTARTVQHLLADLRDTPELVMPASLPQPVSRDPDDDHFLAAGIAARADLIITGDQDLLVLGVYEGIAIMTPARALEMLAAV